MTIIDFCINLKMIKKILVVLGVVDMRQLLLSNLAKIFMKNSVTLSNNQRQGRSNSFPYGMRIWSS